MTRGDLVVLVVLGLVVGFVAGYDFGWRDGKAAGFRVGRVQGSAEELERQIAAMDSINAELAAWLSAHGRAR